MENVILIIHILTGSIALVAGGVSAFAKKGGEAHRKFGIPFVFSMIISALSAIILSLIKPDPFLFGIGLFTLYMTVTGWVVINPRLRSRKIKMNKISGCFGLLFSIIMIGSAIYNPEKISYIPLIFAGIQLLMAIQDFKGEKTGKYAVISHGGKLGGAYIAAVTAFLVVNVSFLPPVVVWLAPTVIGSVLISFALSRFLKI